MNIPLYSQRDTRWGSQKINGTSSSLHDYGCTITCIAMISGRNPGGQEHFMRELGAFQNDLVLWTKTPGFKWRFYCVDTPAPIQDIKNELRAGRPVLVHVDLGQLNDGVIKANHWVLVVDENFTIHDPWYGDKVNLCPRYGKNPETAILGGAYFNPQVDLNDMSQAEKDELNWLRGFRKTILENKQNEYRRDGEDTVRMIIAAPSAEFFTGPMQCSFDNVRLIPGDFPTDPKDWEGQRMFLKPQVDALNSQVSGLKTDNDTLSQQLEACKNELHPCPECPECPECPPASVPVIELPVPELAPKVTVEDLIANFFKMIFGKK